MVAGSLLYQRKPEKESAGILSTGQLGGGDAGSAREGKLG